MWIMLTNLAGAIEWFNIEHMVRVFTDSAIGKGTQIATVDGKIVSVSESADTIMHLVFEMRHNVAS